MYADRWEGDPSLGRRSLAREYGIDRDFTRRTGVELHRYEEAA
jgi:hypothetical protein